MINKIKNCFRADRFLFSKHAKAEMELEEFGIIHTDEVIEVVFNGKIIREYLDDKPYPSYLIYGQSANNRTLHVVCAYSKEEDYSIIITVYQPDIDKWINYERRKK